MKSLEGKVALVTGGGRGLGEAICVKLAEAGATVIVGDFKEDLGRAVAERLEKEGKSATCLAFDVGDEHQVADTFNKIVRAHGKIDILVNNAGTDVTLPVEELSIEEYDQVIRTNLRGPFIAMKLAFPLMKKNGGGSIINIASTAAKRTWANASAYHSSKWGLLGLSHSLHVEGRKENIKVSAVIAGGMRTPFLLDRFTDLDPAILQDPKNVAEAVLFLLTTPSETVVPEITVIPMTESSWP